jgi:hypothetical protein
MRIVTGFGEAPANLRKQNSRAEILLYARRGTRHRTVQRLRDCLRGNRAFRKLSPSSHIEIFASLESNRTTPTLRAARTGDNLTFLNVASATDRMICFCKCSATRRAAEKLRTYSGTVDESFNRLGPDSEAGQRRQGYRRTSMTLPKV